MSTQMTAGKILIGILRFMGKFLLMTTRVILEVASEPKKPICGVAEAYERQENETITPDEFYKATNRY